MSKMSLIPKPTGRGRLSTFDILGGQTIPPIDRLRSMHEDDFEDLVLEWANEFLSNKYKKVRQYGSSGDKGRDVVGFYSNGEIDIYQCKQYSAVLSPSKFWIELGKLCHYTFEGAYPVPKNYFIVTTKGIGTKLMDLLSKPKDINGLLLAEWDDKCKKKIKSTATVLTKELRKYIKDFDFSILVDKAPHELIEEHKQTTYYAQRFGGGLIKQRDLIPMPTANVNTRELNYTNLLFRAYSKKTGKNIPDKSTLEGISNQFTTHFEKERTSFYCAESLDKFSRDNFSNLTKLPFEEMKEDSLLILDSKLALSPYKEDLDRLEEAKLALITQEFSGNPLNREIRPMDKAGMCHYLANENKVKWEK